MRDVVFAFYGEGKADYEFLLRVIERYLKQIAPHADFVPDRVHGIVGNTELERQTKLAEDYAGSHFIIIHLDADARTDVDAIENRLIPDYQKKRIVPIIPIKETEAWILADFEAFKEVIGTKMSAKELGFPAQPKEVEKINEPKEVIKTAISRAVSRRKRIDIEEIYETMGEKVSLEQLEKVPAFQNFRKRIIPILIQLGFRDLE
jgi:hypothetical protein